MILFPTDPGHVSPLLKTPKYSPASSNATFKKLKGLKRSFGLEGSLASKCRRLQKRSKRKNLMTGKLHLTTVFYKRYTSSCLDEDSGFRARGETASLLCVDAHSGWQVRVKKIWNAIDIFKKKI